MTRMFYELHIGDRFIAYPTDGWAYDGAYVFRKTRHEHPDETYNARVPNAECLIDSQPSHMPPRMPVLKILL